MKIKFLLIAALMAVTVTAAASGPDTTVKIRNWSVPASFKTICVSDDIDIILAESSSQIISIEGREKLIEAIVLEVTGSRLTITSRKRFLIGRVRVYIPVSQLQAVVVRGGSEINSVGILNSPSLHIMVEGECRVSVKNRGKIVVDNTSDYEVAFIKNRQFKIAG